MAPIVPQSPHFQQFQPQRNAQLNELFRQQRERRLFSQLAQLQEEEKVRVQLLKEEEEEEREKEEEERRKAEEAGKSKKAGRASNIDVGTKRVTSAKKLSPSDVPVELGASQTTPAAAAPTRIINFLEAVPKPGQTNAIPLRDVEDRLNTNRLKVQKAGESLDLPTEETLSTAAYLESSDSPRNQDLNSASTLDSRRQLTPQQEEHPLIQYELPGNNRPAEPKIRTLDYQRQLKPQQEEHPLSFYELPGNSRPAKAKIRTLDYQHQLKPQQGEHPLMIYELPGNNRPAEPKILRQDDAAVSIMSPDSGSDHQQPPPPYSAYKQSMPFRDGSEGTVTAYRRDFLDVLGNENVPESRVWSEKSSVAVSINPEIPHAQDQRRPQFQPQRRAQSLDQPQPQQRPLSCVNHPVMASQSISVSFVSAGQQGSPEFSQGRASVPLRHEQQPITVVTPEAREANASNVKHGLVVRNQTCVSELAESALQFPPQHSRQQITRSLPGKSQDHVVNVKFHENRMQHSPSALSHSAFQQAQQKSPNNKSTPTAQKFHQQSMLQAQDTCTNDYNMEKQPPTVIEHYRTKPTPLHPTLSAPLEFQQDSRHRFPRPGVGMENVLTGPDAHNPPDYGARETPGQTITKNVSRSGMSTQPTAFQGSPHHEDPNREERFEMSATVEPSYDPFEWGSRPVR